MAHTAKTTIKNTFPRTVNMGMTTTDEIDEWGQWPCGYSATTSDRTIRRRRRPLWRRLRNKTETTIVNRADDDDDDGDGDSSELYHESSIGRRQMIHSSGMKGEDDDDICLSFLNSIVLLRRRCLLSLWATEDSLGTPGILYCECRKDGYGIANDGIRLEAWLVFFVDL